MPRYFFTSIDSLRVPDQEGTDLQDNHAARAEAVRFLGETISHHPELAWQGRYFGVEVANDDGDVLFTALTLMVDGPAAQTTAGAAND